MMRQRPAGQACLFSVPCLDREARLDLERSTLGSAASNQAGKCPPLSKEIKKNPARGRVESVAEVVLLAHLGFQLRADILTHMGHESSVGLALLITVVLTGRYKGFENDVHHPHAFHCVEARHERLYRICE